MEYHGFDFQGKRKMKTVAVVVPAFNEEDCLPELVKRLAVVFDQEKDYEWTLLVVENGSTDSSMDLLCSIAESENRLKIVQLSRNFRMDGGLTAGLSFVDHDACILMTADLQDPPEVIHEFLRYWEQGFESVVAKIKSRKDSHLLRRINSWLFYKLASYLSRGVIPQNASDFRLADRKVYEAVKGMQERNRFVRGLFAWVGFSTFYVEIDRAERFAGESKADTRKVIELAIRGILANSNSLLRFVSIFGAVVSALAIFVLIPLSIFWFMRGVPFAGFGSIVSVIILAFGVTTLILGVVGEYVGLIFDEVKARPNYIISKKVGF